MIGYVSGHVKALQQISMVQRGRRLARLHCLSESVVWENADGSKPFPQRR
jgi:hypothetical protein